MTIRYHNQKLENEMDGENEWGTFEGEEEFFDKEYDHE
jgi:hypothetical protein